MTPSMQITENLRLEIRDAAQRITDPRALCDWVHANGIGAASLSAGCGASEVACQAKLRMGNRFRKDPDPVEYERFSKALTQENFPGRASDWTQDRPNKALLERAFEALDNQPAAVRHYLSLDQLYRSVFEREIDIPGFVFWARKMVDEGIDIHAVEGFLRNSNEAQDLDLSGD